NSATIFGLTTIPYCLTLASPQISHLNFGVRGCLMKDNYQCIVVGAGPAGSTTAALLAQAGHATLLVEREKMPRYHVGESLMPETHGTLERLGVLERMKSGRFTQKVSVQFLSHDGFDSQSFDFQEHTPTACSATWQVERADF